VASLSEEKQRINAYKEEQNALFVALAEKISGRLKSDLQMARDQYQESDSNVHSVYGADSGSQGYDLETLIAIRSLEEGFMKKFVDPLSDTQKQLEVEALDRFLTKNDLCRCHDELWDNGGVSQFSLITQMVLGEAQDALRIWLADVENMISGNILDVMPLGAMGPGKAVESDEDIFSKLSSRQPTSPSEAASEFWAIFCNRFGDPRYGGSHGSEALIPCKPIIQAAKWSSVAKDAGKRRSIVTPTVVSSWLTAMIGNLLAQVLVTLGFGIETQSDRNRVLACLGSLLHFVGLNRPATIDLKDSSDSFYERLIGYLLHFAPNLFRAMKISRDRFVEVSKGVHKGVHKLHIFGTMGNGFTFPLQTLVYLSLVEGVLRLNGTSVFQVFCSEPRIRPRIRAVGVFGDDIILPERFYNTLITVLREIGLIVNEDKSFGEGPFKESCGTDWYNGVNVRPVFCRDLTSWNDVVSLFNRLVDWSVEHEVYLGNTLALILRELPVQYRNAVPPWASYDSGIRVPDVFVDGNRVRDLSRPLQSAIGPAGPSCYVYKPWAAKPKRKEIEDRHGLDQMSPQTRMAFTVYPETYQYGDEPGLIVKTFDPDTAVWVGLLTCHGFVRDTQLSLRSKDGAIRQQDRIRVSHSWDSLPALMRAVGSSITVDHDDTILQWSRFDSWPSRLEALKKLFGGLPSQPGGLRWRFRVT